ncbi:MAG: hypothetical protein KF841_03495 [Phycisphaerae bacterium]|nr:hypothetical protein [Phycisphaerae bacterium]
MNLPSAAIAADTSISTLSFRMPTGIAGAVALAGLAIAVVAVLLNRRLPNGLWGTLLSFGASVALGIVVYDNDWGIQDPLLRIILCGSFVTPLWLLLGVVGRRAATRRASTEKVGEPIANSDGFSAIMAWALLTGTATVAGLASMLLQAGWPRVVSPNLSFSALSATGLTAIGGLIVTVAIWRLDRWSPQQPTVLLALSALFVCWTSLMIPTASLTDEIPVHLRLPMQPGWWTWTFQLQVGLAMVIGVAAVTQDLLYRRKRRQAWPDRLDELLTPYSRWPGYVQLEALIAAGVLILGVYQIVRAGGRGWTMPMVSATAAMSTGVACLYMTYRRWSANTAGLGMGLVSLAIVTVACAAASLLLPTNEYRTYADRMPILFNAILFALSIMIWLWAWLSRVWDQQLLDGIPWTTTGRMIPYARRTSFFLAAISLLVAYQMTLWNTRALGSHTDDGVYRMVFGPLAIGLLGWQFAASARRRNSVAWATFSVAMAVGGVLFIFLRMDAGEGRGWLIQYRPVVLAALSVATLLAAEALPKTSWKTFAPPLWFLALLFLPLKSLIDILPGASLPEAWVSPTTLAVLALLYFIAGSREHRRAFLVLGGVLLLAAGSGAYRL